MSRFVRSGTTVLRLSDGDTLTIKTRLNAGETREAHSRMYRVDPDGVRRVNLLQTGLALVTSYLLDWSVRDDDGAVVPIRGLPLAELEDVLNALDPLDFGEIKDAIQAHEGAQATARAEEKKLRAGSTSGAVTSSSPSAVDGALIGSAT